MPATHDHSSIDLPARERIASDLLGCAVVDGGYYPCPGRHHHTKGDGLRDFRVHLDGAPTGTCFHGSCSGEVEAFNHELRRRIAIYERADAPCYNHPEWGHTAPEPRAKRETKRPPFDPAKLALIASEIPHAITREWLLHRSPVPIPHPDDEAHRDGIGRDFLEHLYLTGEKILIFTEFKSQGQFGHHIGGKSWRLGKSPRIKAVPSALPLGGPEGVWFLCNPVCGEWKPNLANRDESGQPRLGRRHGDCVTAWRYLVLESDHAAPELWLKLLCSLSLKIAAIYTSGGKSIHALIRLDAQSKPQWDTERDVILAALAPLGADPAAMTAVRLSRLPGTLRGDRLQELWYLNPSPQPKPLIYAS